MFIENPQGKINSIYGNPCIKKEFKSFKEYREFQDNNKKGINENNCKPEIQYLTENYHHIEDDKIVPPKLKIYSLDIECLPAPDGSFPDPIKAEGMITSISICHDYKYYVFGLHPYKNTNKNVKYFECKTEEILLKRFLNFVHKNAPDVYTGWNICNNSKMNISGFDFPYLCNRIEKILGEKYYKLLSPIKIVKKYERNGDVIVNIAGVSLLDYQALYKWYSFNNPEKHTLDFISELELDEKKLEYEGTLQELYENDWQTYIDYNIKDTKLVKKLDDKLGYIYLVQSLSLLSRSPFELYYAMTSVLEGKLLTYYRRNGLCAPQFKGGNQSTYGGAYVKQPIPGLYDWVVSMDIASSYPTAIITLNMSLETYAGKISLMTEEAIIESVKKGKFDDFVLMYHMDRQEIKGDRLKKFNLLLKNKLLTVAPCGTIFKTNKKGIIAYVEKEMFYKRKEIKGRMKKEKDKEELKRLHTFQWALKILLNSMYGITAVPYSRYFLLDMAEAITACGRHTIKMGECFTNEILNDPNKKLKQIIQKYQ